VQGQPQKTTVVSVGGVRVLDLGVDNTRCPKLEDFKKDQVSVDLITGYTEQDGCLSKAEGVTLCEKPR